MCAAPGRLAWRGKEQERWLHALELPIKEFACAIKEFEGAIKEFERANLFLEVDWTQTHAENGSEHTSQRSSAFARVLYQARSE